jgi:PST family polysaccharide transporter
MAIGRPDSGWILATLSITVLLSSTQKVPEALLRRNLDFKLIALRSFVAYLLGGVIGIGCAVGGAGIWSLVIKQIVEALILCIFTFHAAKWWPRLGLSFGETRDARRFAGGVLGSWIFTNISSRADSFVVGSLLGTTALGYYSVALRIYFLVRDVFVMVFQRVSISYFAALSAEPSRFSSLFVTLIKATTRLFAPAIATLIGMTPVLIPVLFGARWSAAAGPLQWLSLIPLTMTATCYSWPVMLAKNQTHRILQLTLVGAMWAVAFAVVGCHFGITGAAIGVASQVLITAPLGFYWVAPHAELSLSKIGSTLLPAALGCICALLGASTVSLILAAQQNIIRLLLSLSVGLVLGYGTEYLALNRDERSELWRLVNNLCRSGGALDWSRLATGVKEH